MLKTLSLTALVLLLGQGACTKNHSIAPVPLEIIEVESRPDNGTQIEPNLELFARWNDFYESEFDRGDTVIVAENGKFGSFNPLYARFHTSTTVMGLLFDGLTKILPDFSRGPSLAKSWKFSEDHLELTFLLRDDVHWHDGVQFTAEDVKFTFDLQKNPDVGFTGILNKKDIENCVILDEFKVKFVFSRRSQYQLFDAVVGFPVPKHIWGKIPPEKLRSNPPEMAHIGTGSYKLEEYQPGSFVKLLANSQFYNPRPSVERIIIKIIPDQETRILALKRGEVDVVTRVPNDYFFKLKSLPNVRAYSVADRRYFFIGWNQKNPLFRSVKIRRALTMSIDRKLLGESIFGGHVEIAEGPVSPLLWGHDPEAEKTAPHYDPEAARKLFAAEGWSDTDGDKILDKDGEKFSFRFMANSSNQIKVDTVGHVAGMLRKVGVEVIAELVSDQKFMDSVLKTRDFDAVAGGWSVAIKMDMSNVWTTSAKMNIISYSNAAIDELCDRGKHELDIEEARKIWSEAQRIVIADQPYTFLYRPRQLNLVNSRLRNVQMEAAAWYYNIEQWWSPKSEQRR